MQRKRYKLLTDEAIELRDRLERIEIWQREGGEYPMPWEWRAVAAKRHNRKLSK